MKTRLIRLLKRVLRYLEPDSPALARARALVAAADALKDASGEYKRHQVYARLLKEFPRESKRAISRAIEEALS